MKGKGKKIKKINILIFVFVGGAGQIKNV